MKLSDRASGFLAAALGLAVVLQARTFPPMPGQPVGPSLFPLVIGVGLIAAGATLLVGDARRPRDPLMVFADWARRRRSLGNFGLVLCAMVFWVLTLNTVGFLITAVVFLAVLFFAFGVRRARVLPLALAVTLAIHYAFYTLLRVPLPWGLLEGIAW